MDLNLESKPFLSRLADEISNLKQDKEVLVVLPNRRSLHVLMPNVANHEGILFKTVDDLMQELVEVKIIDPEELLVAFYGAYCKSEKNPQSFDQFSSWAISFLTDANDIDLHLADVDELLKRIDEYHTTGEYFKDGTPGPLEKDYLTFWQRLPKYYHTLKEELSKLGLAYRGWLYRKVAELTDHNPLTLEAYFQNKYVFWVGIIPGNPSEQKLIAWVNDYTDLRVFADVDVFYTDNQVHEAGRLFRTGQFAHQTDWKVDLLKRKAYDFQVHPLASTIGQITKVRALLADIPVEEKAQTVVVLADEKLLTAFLEVFQTERHQFNITTGYPLKNTLIHRFVMSWMQLHAGAIRRTNEVLFYHKHLEEFLEYPIIKSWLQGSAEWAKVKTEIVKKNRKFVSRKWLLSKFKLDMFAEKAFDLLFDWPEATDEIFQRINDVLADWKANTDKLGFARIEQQALPIYIEKLKLLLAQFNELLPSNDLRTLRGFVHRQVGYAKLYLEEPENQCVQVMGMLETRMIDFKHVIIVGATDDVLPGSPSKATHIPFVHRVAFKLPTRKETEALIAYHFYRLIQRAEHVHLLYSQIASGMSSGEGSRYVLQLKEELKQQNPNFKLTIQNDYKPVKVEAPKPLSIPKTEEVMLDVLNSLKRTSPSAINTFINSPLEFYFSKVLKLSEEKKVEEEVENNTFGSIVHNTLEKLYKPFLNQTISDVEVNAMHQKADALVMAEFHELFEESSLETGKNLVRVELAKNFVHSFLNFDAADIREHGPIKILGIELQLRGKFYFEQHEANILAFVDRIDERKGKVRIIDYKTGKVEAKNLKYTWEALAKNFDLSKALQLCFYKWVYSKEYGIHEDDIEPVIYSFGNQGAGYISMTHDSKNETHEMPSFTAGFDFVLHSVFEELFDTSLPFEHREDSKYTTF